MRMAASTTITSQDEWTLHGGAWDSIQRQWGAYAARGQAAPRRLLIATGATLDDPSARRLWPYMTLRLPLRLRTTAEEREAIRLAVEQLGVSSLVVMGSTRDVERVPPDAGALERPPYERMRAAARRAHERFERVRAEVRDEVRALCGLPYASRRPLMTMGVVHAVESGTWLVFQPEADQFTIVE